MRRMAIVMSLCLGLGAMAALILLSLPNSGSAVVAQQGSTHDLMLLDVPMLAVSPGGLEVTHYVGDVTTRALTITNDGLAELTFEFAGWRAVPVREGLVVYYPFSGNTHDESGNGNDGIVYGATLTEDRFGFPNSAYSFDGVDDYVETSQDIDAAANSFGISLWFNHSIEQYCGVLFGGLDDGRVYAAICPGNRLHYWLGEGPEWNIVESQQGAATVESNIWHHLVYTGDGSHVRAYIDGTLDLTRPNSGSAAFATPLDIGTFFPSLPWEGEFFKGIIDDVLIYDRALTEGEIQAVYRWRGDADVPWLSVEPISGTVSASSSQVISVTFDAAGLQPGVYTTQLVVHSNDPFTPSIAIPVSMTVLPSADMGRVSGAVSDGWTGRPITATVELVGVAAQEAAPTYTIWAPAGTYALSANAPGYATNTVEVQITAGEWVAQDLALWPTEMRVYLPAVFRGYCPDFSDDFGNPLSGWYVGEDDYARSEYLAGEYRILTKRSGYIYLYDAPTCSRVDYDVQVDARWAGEPGNSYGLLFGLKGDYRHYYVFDVNTDYGMFRLYRRTPDGFTTIVPATASSYIHRGTASNHLAVRRRGSQITLWVNGVQLGTWHDGVITGPTWAGVMTSPYSDVPSADARFDNFAVATIRAGSAAATGELEGAAICNPSSAHRTAPPAELESWPH